MLQFRSWRDLVAHWLKDLRRDFARENLLSNLKTLAWVVPLTLLIWIFAERSQVVPVKETLPISVKSRDPEAYVVTLEGVPGNQVTATLSGPQSRLANVLRAEVKIEIDPLPGTRTLNAAALLSSQAMFHRNGVTVLDCSPAELTVKVDPIEDLPLEVRVPREVSKIVSSPAFDPKQVVVRGPRELLARARKEQPDMFAWADLREEDLKGMSHFDGSVSISLPSGLDDPLVRSVTPSVRAVFDVKQTTASTVVGAVPIWPLPQPGLFDSYKLLHVKPDVPVLGNVKLVGPPDQIALIEKGTFRPRALLELTQEDSRPPQPRTKALRFDLPPGVTVDPASPPPSIEFRLVDRSATE